VCVSYNNEQHGSHGLSKFIHIIYTLPPRCCGYSFVCEMAPGQNVTQVKLIFYTVEPVSCCAQAKISPSLPTALPCACWLSGLSSSTARNRRAWPHIPPPPTPSDYLYGTFPPSLHLIFPYSSVTPNSCFHSHHYMFHIELQVYTCNTTMYALNHQKQQATYIANYLFGSILRDCKRTFCYCRIFTIHKSK